MDRNQVIYIGSKKKIVDLMSLKEELGKNVQLWKKQYQGATPVVVLSVDKRVQYETFLRLFSEVAKTVPRVRLAFKTDEITT